MSMFCYQCQETAGCKGCTVKGVCGKDESVAKAQDLLIYVTKGLAVVSNEGMKVGVKDSKVNKYIVENLFTTITNANFDRDSILDRVRETLRIREDLKAKVVKAGGKVGEVKVSGGFFKKLFGIAKEEMVGPDAATWTADNVIEFDAKAEKVGVLSTENEDIRSLRELITYGLKGLSAYMKHAMNLKYDDETVHEFMAKALAATLDDSLSVDQLVALALEAGKFGVNGMALLDKANTETYGNPEITTVDIGVRKNPGILISGHDLRDLEMLLEQTEGTGVDVYTHGEMLAGQYYPKFKKYKNFAGNYGNAWWKQKEEFEKFNGPIVMTTNCIVIPKASYKNRLFTTGATGMPGCPHIEAKADGTKDFSEVIKMAKKCSAPTEIEKGQIVGGFAHNQVIALADKVVAAVKSGAIKRFFVMAGCDGRANSRNYYTEFAEKLPKDTVILTAGCAKYKYNKLNLGDIGGIPRVLDAGQCNDSYSLVVIALKLQEVFRLKSVNELPISYNIAWYEQKAVIVLLSLLHLGVKNIHLGPTLPAFLSPNVAKVLVDNFGIGGITNVEDDMKMFMQG
ncbi:hydroxylamine reductase [Clostridium acetobutylicum]|uniref:Hydroxylamine reductase 2 n=1 Tax=Clostridium acetobutylicum (strain ATCC 824 / DSM 792 / JCM 1419 / IAM 19013 / LMG 5710 / NBRC 13948 / NRRL B-527 / VKM B-1787 / 2291 / W) TaxID=272562 RepID=HCP2_CLOAB|nr:MULTISPECIES: hydroxylamine reductase [Clostridium]Q97DP4.1 RecName: Full=Hydroxylamine reductase 2; AltName: Full=Hybrid-cluster protein 2; Short=HCP 2; AltName: Full=Prismane protein 2 [Clostridium acetobutylicum ATCC 824]AAK81358.1 6Fe-6S prismane cluster-containing protein [Clostridium acetobutylicum ATCC 824]ADZ22469.1 Plant auxin-responsive GH3-like protein [Clostridium acetobutylicum EA 2018]AEI33672.1 hydroxylamine reductase [Clostridium acetobutylicum DSM 1731]AWV80974.1 hydroxylam